MSGGSAIRTVGDVTHPAAVSTTTPSSTGPSPLSAGLVAGVLLGVLTQIGQGALPEDAAALLANSGGAWIVASFAVGAVMSGARQAAVAGATTLVAASFTFYEAVELFEGIGSGRRGALIWATAGLVTGPIFGAAGFAARRLPDRRPLALALLGGALTAEAMHLLWWVGNDSLRGVGIAELTIASGVLGSSVYLAGRRRWYTAVAVAAAAWLATRLATESIDVVFSRV